MDPIQATQAPQHQEVSNQGQEFQDPAVEVEYTKRLILNQLGRIHGKAPPDDLKVFALRQMGLSDDNIEEGLKEAELPEKEIAKLMGKEEECECHKQDEEPHNIIDNGNGTTELEPTVIDQEEELNTDTEGEEAGIELSGEELTDAAGLSEDEKAKFLTETEEGREQELHDLLNSILGLKAEYSRLSNIEDPTPEELSELGLTLGNLTSAINSLAELDYHSVSIN